MFRLAPQRTRRRMAGFTLLELLVVLALAGIAAAAVAGGGQAYMDRSRYHQAVREVASQLSQARALCVQEGKTIAITYQPESRQLVVGGSTRIALPDSLQVQWKALEPRTQEEAQSNTKLLFVFNADGGARGGELLLARGAQGVRFQVNWLLGTMEQTPVAAVAS